MKSLEELVRATIPSMERDFDTHDLILKLAQKAQSTEKPFQQLHADIGATIKSLINEFGLKEGKPHKSYNIFRDKSSCSCWLSVEQ